MQIRRLVAGVIINLVPHEAVPLGEPQVLRIDVGVAPAEQVLGVVRLMISQQARDGVLYIWNASCEPGARRRRAPASSWR